MRVGDSGQQSQSTLSVRTDQVTLMINHPTQLLRAPFP